MTQSGSVTNKQSGDGLIGNMGEFYVSSLKCSHIVCIISFQEKLWHCPNGWGQLLGFTISMCHLGG